ncbi:putative jasmonic acid carboxyl methyltransferase 2 [Silene latifolia]|uniref:putative jasmonic acid carboxyl methyltransferase 2 n=1 Tax=Silene latifolia TaxID=37657 RepID=UPI003D779C50
MATPTLHVFHMNGGEGDTSYAKNCAIQSKVLSITRPFVEEAIQDYINKDFSVDTITIAELGCSSGPTALEAVTTIMDVIESRRQRAKLMVYLVDLPGNDFNKVFTFIPSLQRRLREEKGVDFGPCFIAGLPGNFYGRLLPNNSLQFVHCSSSLNWLSQVPLGLEGKDDPKMLNKGKVYLSVTSPGHVIDAYRLQFRKDFTTFLKCRSEEMVLGGRMVLSFMGRRSIDHTFEEDYYPMEFIAQALMTMVSQGRLKEEKVDSFNAPFYAPHHEEVKNLIEEESSFYVDRFEAIEVEWAGGKFNLNDPRLTRGATMAKMQRAVLESMLEHHFGEDIIDELFLRYAKTWEDHLLFDESPTFINLVISLTRM